MQKIIIVQALKEEQVTLPQIDGYEFTQIYTGCGKVSATIALMQAINAAGTVAGVVNVGTAGTSHHKVGDVVVCTKFVDRDLKPLNIYGITSYIETRHEEPLLQKIAAATSVMETCSTGDSFVTEVLTEGDVCDMEAFAQAQVCKQFDVPFMSVKYITDVVGQNSVGLWEERLSGARKGLTEFFKKI